MNNQKGWFNPKHFPLISKFHSLQTADQDHLIKVAKQGELEKAVKSLRDEPTP